MRGPGARDLATIGKPGADEAWLVGAPVDDASDWRARAALRARIELRWPAVEEGDFAGVPADTQALLARLDRADAALLRRLRAAVRAGHGPALLRRWRKEAVEAVGAVEGEGYDALDDLVAGVLRLADPGASLLPLAPEMVFYQPTPARHVLDMLDRLALCGDDLLVDLGSGLGQVPMLAAICTGASVLGVEIQPAFVACARRAARALRLAKTRFVAQDARETDLSAGTVFFLYTPFRGAVLRAVLDALRAQAARRPIRVCSFGPCTGELAAEAWLHADRPWAEDRVAVFHAGPFAQ